MHANNKSSNPKFSKPNIAFLIILLFLHHTCLGHYLVSLIAMSCLNRRRRYIQRREFRLHTLQDLRVGCRLDLLRRCPRTVVTQGVLTADARYGVARSKGFTFRSVRMRNGREDFIALVASIFDWFGGVTRWCVTWISVGIFLFPRSVAS
jgi:hypothetical protein